jgi:hypothetical protein
MGTVHPAKNTPALSQMISEIETYAKKHQLNHRFVGGVSYGGLVDENTTYEIDVLKRTIRLHHHHPFELLRPDGSIRDIDLIILSQNAREIGSFATFVEKLEMKMKNELGFIPPISYEGVYKKREKPPGLLDFVTTLHTSDSEYFLVFDLVSQAISKATLEPWYVTLDTGLTYTTRNPIADYFAYQCRSPAGIKPKDVTKIIHLSKLFKAVLAEGAIQGIDYMDENHYGTWQEFIDKLERSTVPSVQRKRAITRWYWSTLGTAFSHGRGIIGKPALAIFNILNRMYHGR